MLVFCATYAKAEYMYLQGQRREEIPNEQKQKKRKKKSFACRIRDLMHVVFRLCVAERPVRACVCEKSPGANAAALCLTRM